MRGPAPLGGPPGDGRRPAARGQLPSQGEWIRLALCVGAVLALVGYLWGRGIEPRTSGREGGDGARNPDRAPGEEVYGPPPPWASEPPTGTPWRDRPGPPPPTEPFVEVPGVLAAVEDFSSDWEPEAYIHLLHRVNSLDQEEIVRRSQELTDIEGIQKHPEAFRGRFWTVRGTICDHYPKLVPRDLSNPSGVSKAYLGLLLPARGLACNFVVLEKEREYDLYRETVELSGVFFKFHSFQTQAGKTKTLPIFIGRRLTDYHELSYEEAQPREVILFGAVVAFLVMLTLFLAVHLTSSHDRAHAAAYRERTARRLLGRRGGASPGSPVDAGPPSGPGGKGP